MHAILRCRYHFASDIIETDGIRHFAQAWIRQCKQGMRLVTLATQSTEYCIASATSFRICGPLLLRSNLGASSLMPQLYRLDPVVVSLLIISHGTLDHNWLLFLGRAAVLISVNKPLNPANPISLTYTTNLYPVPPNLNLSIALADFQSHYGSQMNGALQQDGKQRSAFSRMCQICTPCDQQNQLLPSMTKFLMPECLVLSNDHSHCVSSECILFDLNDASKRLLTIISWQVLLYGKERCAEHFPALQRLASMHHSL